MYRKVIFGSLVLAGMMGLAIGFYALSGFAQEEEKEETITITTYYPSPYGVYNELQSNKLAVGDADGNGQLTAALLMNDADKAEDFGPLNERYLRKALQVY